MPNNALSYYSNAYSHEQAKEQARMDTTAPQVNEHSQDVTAQRAGGRVPVKARAREAISTTLFIVLFFVGGLWLLEKVGGFVEEVID